MKKCEYIARFKESEWRIVSELHSRVMPIIYGIEKDVEINEIDLKPERGDVIIYLDYKDVLTIIDCNIAFAPKLRGTIEMTIDDLPEWIPDCIIETHPKFEDTNGMRPYVRNGRLKARVTFDHLDNSSMLLTLLDALLSYRNRMKTMLRRAGGSEDVLKIASGKKLPKSKLQEAVH